MFKNKLVSLIVVIAAGFSLQVQAGKASRDNPPTASFTVLPNPVEPGATASFDGSASSDDNGITGYCWDFGDGSAQDCSGAIVARSYAAEGSYTATLTVTDTAGNTDSASNTVVVEIDRVAVLEAAVAALQAENADLKSRLSAVEANSVLALDGLLSYTTDNSGYETVLVRGANLQVVNGAGASNIRNGLGNLIVGYNPVRAASSPASCNNGVFDNQTDCEANGWVWAVVHRTGSHNLVVGGRHNYAMTSGVVFGELNTLNINGASILGGFDNTVRGVATVVGGSNNTAKGWLSVVGGGINNTANGNQSVVSGGRNNTADGNYAAVVGGISNSAATDSSSILGGRSQTTTVAEETIPALP